MEDYKNKVKLFYKSICFSGKLVFQAGKWRLIAYFICNLIVVSLSLVNIYLLKIIIDGLSEKSKGWQELSGVIIVYAGVFLCSFFIGAFSQMLYGSTKEKAFMIFNMTILNKMKYIPIEFLDSSSGKDFLMYARCANENAVNSFFNILSIITGFYTFAVGISIIAEFSAAFALILIFTVVPGIVLSFTVKKRRYKYQFKSAYSSRKFSYYYAMLTSQWAAKDIRIYNLFMPIKQRYEEERIQYDKGVKKLDLNQLLFSIISVLIEHGGVIIFTIYLLYKAFYARITVGDVTMYIGYSVTMCAAFSSIISTITSGFQDSQLVMDAYFKLMELDCRDENIGISKIKLEKFESLAFENVYFKYPNTEKYVLRGVSFQIHKGDRLSIVGVNGAGKSTIIKVMLRLYEIESGNILINGYPMDDYDVQDIRKMISVLFQDFVKYPLTLRENIGLSDYKLMGNDQKVYCHMREGGITDDIMSKLPHGIDSNMTREYDDDGVELSKGQWQKIAISRAYFKNAEIIVFDEPSAALDAESEDRVFEKFQNISKEKTGIMISHRISSSRIASKVIVLDGGKIVEMGTHDELLQKSGLYAKLYNLQKQKYTMET